MGWVTARTGQRLLEQSQWEGYSLLPGLGDHQVLHHLPLQGQRLQSRRGVGNIHPRPMDTSGEWGSPRDPLPAWQPALSGSQLLPSPHLPGMFSAQPGLGSAAPPAPRRPPSASGSAGRPPPAGSAPCRNSLSTRHRAQDTCQDHILLRDPAGGHGATASPCVAVLARPHVPNRSCLNPPCPTRRV